MKSDIGRTYSKKRRQEKNTWRLLLIPLVIAIGSFSFLVFDTITSQHQKSNEETYSLNADRSISYTINYLDNSYFKNLEPSDGASAYVRELTKDINVDFSSSFNMPKDADITYSYDVTSKVSTFYTPKGETNVEDVWSEKHVLLEPRTGRVENGTGRATAKVVIPFKDYSDQVLSMNNNLALALDSKVVVTFEMAISGEVKGQKINEKCKMQVSMPLNQSIYTVSTEYQKREARTVVVDYISSPDAWWRAYTLQLMLMLGAVILSIIALMVRPWRFIEKDIERNPYKKELNRIYRYHDGLIIRTQRPVDLEDQEVIAVASFDDLLNLSEELRLPIIANQLNPGSTRFFVIHDTTVYSYLVEDALYKARQEASGKSKTTKKPKVNRKNRI